MSDSCIGWRTVKPRNLDVDSMTPTEGMWSCQACKTLTSKFTCWLVNSHNSTSVLEPSRFVMDSICQISLLLLNWLVFMLMSSCPIKNLKTPLSWALASPLTSWALASTAWRKPCSGTCNMDGHSLAGLQEPSPPSLMAEEEYSIFLSSEKKCPLNFNTVQRRSLYKTLKKWKLLSQSTTAANMRPLIHSLDNPKTKSLPLLQYSTTNGTGIHDSVHGFSNTVWTATLTSTYLYTVKHIFTTNTLKNHNLFFESAMTTHSPPPRLPEYFWSTYYIKGTRYNNSSKQNTKVAEIKFCFNSQLHTPIWL